MSTGAKKEDINSLKEDLKMFNDFIKNAEKEYSKELEECRKDYQEACKEIEREQRQYQKDLQDAKAKNYGPSQIETLNRFHEESIEAAENQKRKALEFLQQAQEQMDSLPQLLEDARKGKQSTEAKINLLRASINTPKDMIGGAIIWIIIIAAILKACGG